MPARDINVVTERARAQLGRLTAPNLAKYADSNEPDVPRQQIRALLGTF
jgi:hypothetical protein